MYDPWHPNYAAIAKVKDKLPAPTICRYCQGTVIIANNSYIYNGTSYGDYPWIYVCTSCKACIGMHPETDIPLGTLANAELRKVRMEVKNKFNPLWQGRKMSRTEAYQRLAKAMGISQSKCHFGMFDLKECYKAMSALRTGLEDKVEDPAWKSKLKKAVVNKELDTSPKFKSFKNVKKI